MNEWCIYIALYFIAVHPKRFTIMWAVSPQTPPMCSIHLMTFYIKFRTFKKKEKKNLFIGFILLRQTSLVSNYYQSRLSELFVIVPSKNFSLYNIIQPFVSSLFRGKLSLGFLQEIWHGTEFKFKGLKGTFLFSGWVWWNVIMNLQGYVQKVYFKSCSQNLKLVMWFLSF